MGMMTLRSNKYGSLLAETLPKVIETDEELEHFAQTLEDLVTSGRVLSPEENALRMLLTELIQVYDDKIELPDVPPLETLRYLMEQRGTRQADLAPILGSRTAASQILTGKRKMSKAQIRKLGEFFHISPEVFL